MRAADSVTELGNRLRLATGSANAAAQAYAALLDIAQASRVGFTELGTTYASIARASGELGLGQQQLLRVTEAIANAMTISGGSAASMQAALVQLSQGLASGTLRGDELNSVMEQAPRLAQALAAGLGVSIGQLRQMGQEGQLSAQAVIAALQSQADVLKGEVAGSIKTVGQGWTQVKNAAVDAVGSLDSATGASSGLANALGVVAKGIGAIADAIKTNGDVVRVFFASLGGGPLAGLRAAAGQWMASADGIRSSIQGIEQQIKDSEEALARARARGAQAAADNIQKTIDAQRAQLSQLRRDLLQLESPALDTRAEDQRLSAMAGRIARQKKLAEEADALRQKLDGVDKGYIESVKELIRLHQEGAIGAAEYQKRLKDLQTILLKKQGAVVDRLPSLKDAFDAQAAALRESLKTSADLIEAALKAQLVGEREALEARAVLRRRAMDEEQADLRAQLAAQQGYIQRLRAVAPKDANQRQEIAEKIDAAAIKAQQLQVQIDAIDARRTVVDVEIAFDAQRLERDLADARARIEREIAQATGTETPQQRRAAIEAEYRDLLARFAGDAALQGQVLKLIDVRAAQADLAAVEQSVQQVTQRMQAQQALTAAQRQAGQITAADALARDAQASGAAHAALAGYVAELERLAAAGVPNAEAALDRLRAQMVQLKDQAGQKGWADGIAAGARAAADSMADSFGQVKAATQRAFDGLTNTLTQFVMTGKLSFKDLANSIIADLVRIAIQRQITLPLAQMLGIVPYADGGIPGGASISAWRNQVVDRPTFFAFARGGVMGEAGPEAIMPLTRGPGGRLGVDASGVGGSVTVNVINKADGTRASARERTDSSGARVVDVLIEQVQGAIAGDIARGAGPVPSALAATYGLNRVAGAY